MRFVKAFPLLAIALLLVLLCACSGGGSKTSIDLMKKVPDDSTSFTYWEIKTLSTDDDLLDIYEMCKLSDEIEQLRDIGVTLADIDHVGRASGFGQATVTVLSGELDIEEIERELDEREDYQVDPHQEASIWTPIDPQDDEMSIAVRDSVVLMGDKGDIEECIDAIALEQHRDLHEDKNVSLVTDRLPDGVLVQVNKAGVDPEENYNKYLQAYGKSYDKKGEEELKLTAVYMFEDYSATVKETQDAIEAYLGNKGFRDIEVKQFDERFLKATAVIYTLDFVDILEW